MSETGDNGFARRLSPLIAFRGVTAVPNLLLQHQARLGLSSSEVVYVIHVLSHHHGAGWPWVSVGKVADSVGVTQRMARNWKASLIRKGYLHCSPRVVPGVGRRADEHDLTGLYAALESVALEQEAVRPLNEARRVPAPIYHVVPRLSPARTETSFPSGPEGNFRDPSEARFLSPGKRTSDRDRNPASYEQEASNKKAVPRTQQQTPYEESTSLRDVRASARANPGGGDAGRELPGYSEVRSLRSQCPDCHQAVGHFSGKGHDTDCLRAGIRAASPLFRAPISELASLLGDPSDDEDRHPDQAGQDGSKVELRRAVGA